MIKYSKLTGIIGILLFMTLLYSCVEDGTNECPEGDVSLRLYAERFQNSSQDPLNDTEAVFADRINHIRYYLYREDGSLYDQGIIEMPGASGTRSFNPLAATRNTGADSYVLPFSGLEPGKYKAAIVANCTKKALEGDGTNIDNLMLRFAGCNDTEDFFARTFDFDVIAGENKEYKVGLSRVHGVVRYKFVNLPSDASEVGVTMIDVSNEKWINGDYKTASKADLRYKMIPVTRATAEDYVMGTFPTLTDGRSTLHVNLYRDGEVEHYFTQMVSDTLSVIRNQLLDVVLTYNDGKFDYQILLDSSWDGSSSGGQIGIQ